MGAAAAAADIDADARTARICCELAALAAGEAAAAAGDEAAARMAVV